MDIKERLEKTLDKVNKEYFSNGDIPTIRLSKGQDKKNRRAIVFGTYHAQKNEIKIHPVLLQEEVEDFVLEFIIYHEMLHYEDRDELLIRKKGQLVHTSRFKQREKYFRQYEEAQEILKNILHGRELVKGSEESTENTEKIESSTNKKVVPKKTTSSLSGTALEEALTESLQRLEHIMIKYNMIEPKSKGAKRGTKKRNEEEQLAGNV